MWRINASKSWWTNKNLYYPETTEVFFFLIPSWKSYSSYMAFKILDPAVSMLKIKE